MYNIHVKAGNGESQSTTLSYQPKKFIVELTWWCRFKSLFQKQYIIYIEIEKSENEDIL